MTTRSSRPSNTDGPGPSAPIQVHELLSRCSGNVSLAVLLLEKFDMQLRSNLVAIAELAAAGDVAGLSRAAHSLKGAAGAVVSESVHARAASLEASLKTGRNDDLEHALSGLAAEISRCISYIPLASAVVRGHAGDRGAQREVGR